MALPNTDLSASDPTGTPPTEEDKRDLRLALGLIGEHYVASSGLAAGATLNLSHANGELQKVTLSSDSTNVRTINVSVAGPPIDGTKILLRIKCGSTAAKLCFHASIKKMDESLIDWPTGKSLTINKFYRALLEYNADNTAWELLSFVGGT